MIADRTSTTGGQRTVLPALSVLAPQSSSHGWGGLSTLTLLATSVKPHVTQVEVGSKVAHLGLETGETLGEVKVECICLCSLESGHEGRDRDRHAVAELLRPDLAHG